MSENVVLLRKVRLQQALEQSGQTMNSFLIKRLEEKNSSKEEIREFGEHIAQAPNDLFMDFFARLPKPSFDKTLAEILSIEIPEEKADTKSRIMNFLITENTDVRKFLKENFFDVRRAEAEGLEEFQLAELEFSQATDDEVREFFVEMIVERLDKGSEAAQRMLAMIEFSEFFFKEGDPKEVEFEKLLADTAVADATAAATAKRSAHEEKVRDIFGPIGVGHKRDTGKTEEELIEQLNRLEYRRDESVERFSAVQKLSGTSRGDLDKAIRETKDRLSEIQGGKLDRFGLRNFSAAEVKQLIESTQADIDEMVGTNVQTQAALNKLAEHFKAPPGLTDLFAPASNRYRLSIKKRLLAELKLRLVQASVKGNKPHDRAAQVAAEVQEMTETITLLEQRCEDQVRRNPRQADAIRRRYRMRIDALKESE